MSLSHQIFMSEYLIALLMMVLFVKPASVELSVWMGDFGCGHPISTRVFRIVTMVLAVVYRAASSASAADAMIDLMFLAIVNTAPFNGGVGQFQIGKYGPLPCFDILIH